MDFISSKGGMTLLEREAPKLYAYQSQFSGSESFYRCIVTQKASWKDIFHFIHWEDPFINGNSKAVKMITQGVLSDSRHR